MLERFTKSGLAAELVKKMPDAPAWSLARRLRADHPQVFHSVDAARSSVRYILGANGTHSRKCMKDKSLMRPHRKTTAPLILPPSQADPWLPFQIKGPAVVAILCDVHIPYHDVRAVETAVSFIRRKFKPTHLLLNGDFGDFYGISRYLKNPSKRDLKGELAAQRQALEWFAGVFDDCERLYKDGNHDERWDHWIWQHAAELADVKDLRLHTMLRFRRHGFKRISDCRPIIAGSNFAIWHGHEFGKGGASNPVSPSRGAFLKTLNEGAMGHLHKSSNHIGQTVFKHEIPFYSVGMLGDMRPDYAKINDWNQGFAVAAVSKAGECEFHNYRINAAYQVRVA